MNTNQPKQKKIKEKQYAKFDQLSNDMYWSWYHSEYSEDYSQHHFEKIRWIGYNDSFWWTKVAKERKNRIRTCKCGKKFIINYETNEVKEILL